MGIIRAHFTAIFVATTLLTGTTSAQPSRVSGEHYVTVGDVMLHYRTGGTGPHLIMLHGFTLSSEQWSEYFDDFGSDYTIVAFDLPGHGKSDRPKGTFSYESWAELVLQAVELLGIDSAVGIGHSAGAITLLHMADRKPDLFRALVLVAGSPVMSTAGKDLPLHDSFDKADESLKAYYLRIHSGDTARIGEIFSDLRFMATQVPTFGEHPPIMERLKRLTVPVYMVWGDRDLYFPMEIATELYRTFPNARLWVVPFQGHTPVWEAFGADTSTTERFADSARKFLGTYSAAMN